MNANHFFRILKSCPWNRSLQPNQNLLQARYHDDGWQLVCNKFACAESLRDIGLWNNVRTWWIFFVVLVWTYCCVQLIFFAKFLSIIFLFLKEVLADVDIRKKRQVLRPYSLPPAHLLVVSLGIANEKLIMCLPAHVAIPDSLLGVGVQSAWRHVLFFLAPFLFHPRHSGRFANEPVTFVTCCS